MLWPAPTDFVHGSPLPPPTGWTRPGLVMTFNLECPGCVSRGIPFLKRLHAEYPEVKVLVLSMLAQEEYVSQLFDAGALGYALKNDDFPGIVLAVNTVATGRQYLCSELCLLMLHRALMPKATVPEASAPNPYGFSTRELEVLHALADGLTTAEIATKLFTNRRVIETLRQQLLDKSKARNVAMLIRLVMTEGMLR